MQVTRDGKWWMVSIPALDGLTQARRLADVDHAARGFIACHLDVDVEDVVVHEVSLHVEGVGQPDDELAELAREKAEAVRLGRSARERSVRIARALHAIQVPIRDIGTTLNVSYQRAYQLITDGAAP